MTVQPSTPPVVNARSLLLGGAPGEFSERMRVAMLRAVRTLLQGVAGAFPAAGLGTAVLTTSYWATFGYSCIAAGVAALACLLQNVASIFPEDPTQKTA
jgi:hypothetical protein